MKYRNIIKNQDGTHNIVWFGSAGIKNIAQFPLTFSITLQSKNHPSTISTQTIDFTKEDIENSVTKTLTINTGWFESGNVRHVIGKYDIIINGTIANITCTNQSDFVSGSRLAIKTTDIICIANSGDFTTLVKSSNNMSGNFTMVGEVPTNHNKIPAENYVEGQEGVAKSLTQWLSVIKGELWYNINFGLPLLDKIRNKAIYDAYIIKIISAHYEVKTIKQFVSSVENNVYTYNCTIISIFDEEFNLNSQASI